MRRTVGLLSLGVLLFAGVLVAPVARSSVLAASYTYPCNSYPTANYKALVFRDTGDDYYGVIGDAKVQGIGTCTGTISPVVAYVLPANLQKVTATTDYIVQLGWMVCSGSGSGTCGNVPSDGLMHFMYICNDASGGVPCLADGWVGSAPEIGDRYRFRIDKSGSNWLYTLQNITEGWTSTKTIARSAGFDFGQTVWWGAENYNKGSMMGGGQAAASMIQMYWMQYHRNSISGWQVATPTETVGEIAPGGGLWPTWWKADNYSQNYVDDAQNIWTTTH